MKLLITRPLEKSIESKKELEAVGHTVFILPMLEYAPPSDGGKGLQNALQRINQYDTVIATSAEAIKAMSQYISEIPDHIPFVTVGPKTAALGAELGWPVWQPPKSGGAQELIAYFEKKKMRGKKILYPQSNIGLSELPNALKAMGAVVDVVEAYQTRPTPVTREELEAALHNVEGVLFYSPSAVERFVELGAMGEVKLFAVGETTRQALMQKGFSVEPFIIPA